MAGRIAEEIFMHHITTGAGNDIERATEMARKMVCEWGMSELGPMSYGKKEEQIFLGREIAQHRDYSEATAIESTSRSASWWKPAMTARRASSWKRATPWRGSPKPCWSAKFWMAPKYGCSSKAERSAAYTKATKPGEGGGDKQQVIRPEGGKPRYRTCSAASVPSPLETVSSLFVRCRRHAGRLRRRHLRGDPASAFHQPARTTSPTISCASTSVAICWISSRICCPS